MAIRNVVTEPDEILHKNTREVTVFDEKLGQLIDDMFETMYHKDGVGLAAPQIGILRKICVIDIGDGKIELVNPVIVKQSGKQYANEGCLSCPEIFGTTERPKKVTVRAYNRNGELYEIKGTDLLARALCHEIDHLSGVLFTEHVVDYDN